MKKLTLFVTILTAMAVNAQTVLYQEDFESYTVGDNVGEDTDIPAGFLSYDVDGDGYNWGLSNPVNFTQTMGDIYDGNFIMSASYITLGAGGNGNQGSRNANNILVLPMQSIPAGASDVKLIYYRGGATSSNFFSETYHVTVTTDSEESTILAAIPIYSETLAANTGLNRILNLDAFAGQDIYISFRHQTADQWLLGLDNIKIEATTLGLEENSFEGFSHFIDSENNLNLKADNPFSNVQLFNVLGQQVISQKLSKMNERINLSELSSGVYIIKVDIDGIEKTFKIVKY